MKILAFSDVHGNYDAVSRMLKEAKDLDHDIILFGGDFTNAWFDGADIGQTQMNQICQKIEETEKPFYYIYGNRDIYVKCPIGFCINEKNWDVDGYTLTNDLNNLHETSILITHSIQEEMIRTQANSLLYLYGHDHIGRVYKNYIDLGFLYRGKEAHGARESLYGCYWIITLEVEGISIENHSWDLQETHCSIHSK